MHTLDASTGFIHNGLAGVIAGWIVEDVPDEVNFRLEMGGGHQEAKAEEGSRLRGAGVRAPRQQTACLVTGPSGSAWLLHTEASRSAGQRSAWENSRSCIACQGAGILSLGRLKGFQLGQCYHTRFRRLG